MRKKDKKRRNNGVFAIIVYTIAALGIAIFAITPKSYNLKIGDIAPETITASREVEDILTTQELKKAAREAVEDVFTLDQSKTDSIKKRISDYFDGIEKLKQRGDEMLTMHNAQAGTSLTYEQALNSAELDLLRQMLNLSVQDNQIFMCLNTASTLLEQAETKLTNILDGVLQTGLKHGEVTDKQESISQQLESEGVSGNALQITMLSVREFLEPNLIFDEQETEKARKTAEDSVAPVVYKKNQVIVRQGDEVTNVQINILSTLGMLKTQLNIWMYLGVSFIILLLSLLCVLYFLYNRRRYVLSAGQAWMFGTVIILTLLATAGLARLDMRLVPVSFTAVAVTTIISPSAALIASTISIIACSAVAFGMGVPAMTIAVFILGEILACFFIIYAARKYINRVGITVMGIAAGVLSAMVFLAVGMLMNESINKIAMDMLLRMLSGLLAGVLCLGLTPVWESIFKVLTPMKLMELCNPTNALLKRLTIEAPGTYQHSVMVANLAECAAEAIGADPHLARAGAYYHDIGKLTAPMYFKENQLGGNNPHDKLDPEKSARIISSHTHDGAKMMSDAGMPKELIDITLQHHGNTAMVYFLKQAVESNPEADIDAFRHTGEKPTTAEAVIVMLADACEAAVRAGTNDYSSLIKKIIKDRLDDGQLDKAPITLKDLDTIRKSFEAVFQGAYHNRIAYPQLDINDIKTQNKPEKLETKRDRLENN